MTITIDGIDVQVTTEMLNTAPPAVRVRAENGTTVFVETLTIGPNNPESTTSAGELQAILDDFRQRLAQKVVNQIQLLSMLNSIQ